jgi:hypothetical protein
MALTVLHHQLVENQLETFTTSIGASPVAAQLRSPFRGRITKVGAVTGGTITTSNCSVAVSINGAATFVSFNINFTSATAGQHFSATPSGAISGTTVNEDDVITFTPSNASGATIPAFMYAVIRKAGV